MALFYKIEYLGVNVNKKILAVLALLGFSTAQAAVLQTNYEITVLGINGELITNEQKIDDTHVKLPNGEAQILVEQEGIYQDGSSSDTALFTSKPYLITFDASQKTFLQVPKRMREIQDVEALFATDSPAWRLVDMSGNPVAYKTELLPPKKGFMPYGDLEEIVAKYNKKNGIIFTASGMQETKNIQVSYDDKGRMTALNASVAVLPNVTPVQPVVNNQVQLSPEHAGTEAMTQLKLWYNKATTAEKRMFRHWMLDQGL